MAVLAPAPGEGAGPLRAALLIAVGALLCASAAPCRGDVRPSIDRILRRLLLGGRGFNMRGRQVLLVTGPNKASRITTMEVVCTRDGLSRALCVSPAAQRGAVTVDDGEWIKSYDPRARRITVARSIPRASGERAIQRLIRLIHNNYVVRDEGRQSIANRACYRLDFTPRADALHPPISHPVRLWVDAYTGIVLSNEERDFQDNTLSLAVFTSVEFPRRIGRSEASYRFPRGASRSLFSRSPIMRDVAQVRRRAGFDVVMPLEMPGGYEFDHCELMSLHGVPAVCLRYTDGLTNITICQNPARRARPPGWRQIKVSIPPQGDVMVACASGSMEYMVVGRGEPSGLVAVARALDRDRERECLEHMARAFRVRPSVLTGMRDRGLGVGAMAALLQIGAQTGRRLQALLALYDDGFNWRSIAEQLKTDPLRVRNTIRRFEIR